NRLHDYAVRRLSTVAGIARDHLDTEMFERKRHLQNLAESLGADTLDDEEWRRIIESTHQLYPDYSWLGLVDLDGTVRIANGGLLEGQSVAARTWFVESLKGPFVGDVHDAVLLAKILEPAPDGQLPRFVDFAFPLVSASSGKVVAVLGAHLNWTWANEVLAPFILAENSAVQHEALILDRNGIVLHGPRSMRGSKAPMALPTSDVQVRTDAQGYAYAAARTRGYRDYSGLGWTVVVRTPMEAIYRLADAIQRIMFWSSLPAIALFLVVATLVSRRIAYPIEMLTQAVIRDAPLPTITAYREAADLAKAFEMRTGQLRAIHGALEGRVAARTSELEETNRSLEAGREILELIAAGAPLDRTFDRLV
ncbi:MAG: hypothetical protein HQL39_18605, partial [Alphaproteobacteria bacterium]|nr:hypothetical protein [Alphaproteobacteria bacterium]